MSFHEVRFPDEIAYGSKGGPKFKTTIFESDGGWEQRNIDWSEVRAEYDVSHGIKDRDQMDELRDFFYARRGRAYGFRFKDWGDYYVVNQLIGTGDGTKDEFQVVKTYTSGGYTYARKIRKLVDSSITQVLVNGVPTVFSANNNTGIITLGVTPTLGQEVIVTYGEFDVPVRFDTDHLDPKHDFWEHQSWDSIPLLELRQVDA